MNASIAAGLVETCIQYGFLGVLGWIALRVFVKQSKNSDEYMKKLFEYITDEKKCNNEEVLETLGLIIQTINKNQENLIRFKYELVTELQKLGGLIKEIQIDDDQKEKIDEIVSAVDKIQSAISLALVPTESSDNDGVDNKK